jgi:hypothetical protein
VEELFSAWSVPHLYNESLFVAWRCTESGTTETGDRIRELCRLLEGRHSKVIEEEIKKYFIVI